MTRKELDNYLRMIQLLHEAKELQRITMDKAEKEKGKGNTALLRILHESLADINQSIVRYENLIAASSPDVAAFISSVKAPRIRQMLRLRYLHGLDWCEIPDYFGPGISEAGCRVACARYLRAHCS